MQPIAPLMIEHRIIERMIAIIQNNLKKLKATKSLDIIFIDAAVDFIRTYADQTHHGKEEDILFRELKKKELKPEHKLGMEDLIQDHIIGRKTTMELVASKEKFLSGDTKALDNIIQKLEFLVDFYPKHIEKEDKKLFRPMMDYFTNEEQQAMLIEGQIYDRKMIHRKYDKLVGDLEKINHLPEPKRQSNWLDYM